MTTIHEKRYRVAQWATGNIGLRSLRAVIEHPQFDLVGLYVYSDAKAGRDAGENCVGSLTPASSRRRTSTTSWRPSPTVCSTCRIGRRST